MNLQNFNESNLSQELLQDAESSTELNLRGAKIESLHLNSDTLQWIDLKQTKSLKEAYINCPNLQTINLTGTALKKLEISSDSLLNISIRGARDLEKLVLETENLEHIELSSDKIETLLLPQTNSLKNIKGINHIYNDRNINIREFIGSFIDIERERLDEINRHKGDCCCDSCKGDKELFIEGLNFKLKL